MAKKPATPKKTSKAVKPKTAAKPMKKTAAEESVGQGCRRRKPRRHATKKPAAVTAPSRSGQLKPHRMSYQRRDPRSVPGILRGAAPHDRAFDAADPGGR